MAILHEQLTCDVFAFIEKMILKLVGTLAQHLVEAMHLPQVWRLFPLQRVKHRIDEY